MKKQDLKNIVHFPKKMNNLTKNNITRKNNSFFNKVSLAKKKKNLEGVMLDIRSIFDSLISEINKNEEDNIKHLFLHYILDILENILMNNADIKIDKYHEVIALLENSFVDDIVLSKNGLGLELFEQEIIEKLTSDKIGIVYQEEEFNDY